MKARLMLHERRAIGADRFIEMVVWQLPRPLRGSTHRFKYRLAFVVADVCVLRYDNESGKGDHRHIDDVESPYAFTTPDQLFADFIAQVSNWRN